jgi:hypothetical protein
MSELNYFKILKMSIAMMTSAIYSFLVQILAIVTILIGLNPFIFMMIVLILTAFYLRSFQTLDDKTKILIQKIHDDEIGEDKN